MLAVWPHELSCHDPDKAQIRVDNFKTVAGFLTGLVKAAFNCDEVF